MLRVRYIWYMKTFILFLALCGPLLGFGQSTLQVPTNTAAPDNNNKSTGDEPAAVDNTPVEPAPSPVFTVVESMPEFPGGQAALMKYLSSNIRYPQDAREMGIEGKVYLSFVVDKEGYVKNVEIRRGVYTSMDMEAVRVVKAMPRWKPGTQDGKPVNVLFNLPINFKLQ